MAIKLSCSQVNSWRLSKNHLDKRTSEADMARVVSDLCGVQAQVLSGAALSLWARVDNISIHDVEDALWKHRTLVKTWCMRGTLHLLNSTDLSTYVAALKTRLEHFRESREQLENQYRINRSEQDQVTTAVHNALDQHNLTREELAREVVKHTRLRPTIREHLLSGWGSLLQPAAFQGSLIFGPSQGPKVTFTRPDQWLGKQAQPPSQEALKTLLRQFYNTYGPATYQDFGHWWGVRAPEARTLVQLIIDELEEVEFNNHRSMMLSCDIAQIQAIDPVHSIRLVPSWDTYVMFYHPRELLAPQAYRARIFRQLEGNAPVLLIDGVAAGTWEKHKATNQTRIAVKPFKPLNSNQKLTVEEEAKFLGEFLKTKVHVSFST